MRIARVRLSAGALMWVGLLAAPAAWTGQLVAGVWLQIARCHDRAYGASSGLPVDAVTIAVGAAAAALALIGLFAAIAAWWATRRADDDDPPPSGRIHFLGVVGITISPLFLAMIVMSSAGGIAIVECVQS
jgi:ABC-type iron transport system FetAB permease component